MIEIGASLDWSKTQRDGDEAFEFEYRLRRADGVYRWFLARAEPICDDDGRVVRWFGTSTDIDDRKRAEDARLRESEERLRLAAAAARLGYWDWDILTDRITWSESLAEIAGTAPAVVRGHVRRTSWLRSITRTANGSTGREPRRRVR